MLTSQAQSRAHYVAPPKNGVGKRPWFSFYVADWLVDTASMSLEEQGAYMRLLSHQWQEGGIPSEPKRIARVLGVTFDHYLAELAPMVEANFDIFEDSKLRNPRLEIERAKADAVSEAAADNGRKGGHKTASGRLNSAAADSQRTSSGRGSGIVANHSHNHIHKEEPEEDIPDPPSAAQDDFVIDPSSAFGAKENTPTLGLKSDPPVAQGLKFDFEAIYAEYPRKEGKKRGLACCRSIIKTRLKYDALLMAVRNYAATVSDIRFAKHFDTFMGCWEDYADAGLLAPRTTLTNGKPYFGPRAPVEALTEGGKEIL